MATHKKERDNSSARSRSDPAVRVDGSAEVEKDRRAAPGAKGFCRHSSRTAPGQCRLARNSGCDPEMRSTCGPSQGLGWRRAGSRSTSVPAAQGEGVGPRAGDGLERVPRLAERGITSPWSKMGGGFPNALLKDVPPVVSTARSIFPRAAQAFWPRDPETSSSRAAAWSATRQLSRPDVVLSSKKARDENAAGSISTSASSRPRRTWTRRSYAIKTPLDGAEMALLFAGTTCDFGSLVRKVAVSAA